MPKSKIILLSLLHSLGVLAYVSVVAWFMFNGERIFGEETSFLMPAALLLLFVFSALVTGLLVLGRPIWWYLKGLKLEAVKLLFYTVGWLFLATIVVFLIFLII